MPLVNAYCRPDANAQEYNQTAQHKALTAYSYLLRACIYHTVRLIDRVGGIAFQSSEWLRTEFQKLFGIGLMSVWYEIQQILRNGSESKFVCVISVMKQSEMCVLQAASIVGLSPASLAAFHELTPSKC